MPRTSAESHHAEDLQRLLHTRKLTHLRTRRHGSAVIVESGPPGDPVKHFRVRRDGADLWCLDIADHRGTWEPTPYRDRMEKLARTALDEFPWTVEDVFGDDSEGDLDDPDEAEGTSGAEY